MKNLVFLLMLTLVSMGFTSKKMETPPATRYAFVTDLEHDKSYDQPGKAGIVSLTSEVVSYSCDITDNNIKYQYIDHYNAYEKTGTKNRWGETTSVWTYSSYDEAVSKRRERVAKTTNANKRTVYNFYISCKN